MECDGEISRKKLKRWGGDRYDVTLATEPGI